MPNPFDPLTPEQLAEHLTRRTGGEAEIARKEAALAKAEAALARTRGATDALEAEFGAYRRQANDT